MSGSRRRSTLPNEADEVHRQLTELLAERGPLGSTPQSVLKALDDRLLRDVADEYRELTAPGRINGRVVVVTAGPPGAGKSTAVAELATEHRIIDPDDIKTLVLRSMESDGLLDVRHDYVLADGHPVSPGELSTWVHRFSTDVADEVQRQSLRSGENVMLAGTLQWDRLPVEYHGRFARYDYESLIILDVEVPIAVAQERAKERWWKRRSSGSVDGGRFVPIHGFDRFYIEDGISVCSANARSLFELAEQTGDIDVEIRFMHTGANLAVHTALLTPDEVVHWNVPGQPSKFGAGCARCGAPLTAKPSIRRGYGDHCWTMTRGHTP